MPLYEYECDACGNRFEMIRKFSDAPVDTCPKCGGVVRKLMSSPAIQFKGSGFYITDYAKKDESTAKKDDAAGEKAAKPESGTKESTKDAKDTKERTKDSKESKPEKPASDTAKTPTATASPAAKKDA